MVDDPTVEDLVDIATERFATLESAPDADDLLTESEHAFQFNLTEGGSFVIDIANGEYEIQSGESDRDPTQVTPLTADAETIEAVLRGRTTIVDEVWEANLQAQVYGMGMEDTSWISRILRAIRNVHGQHVRGPTGER